MHVHGNNSKLSLVDDKRYINTYESTPASKVQSFEKDVLWRRSPTLLVGLSRGVIYEGLV